MRKIVYILIVFLIFSFKSKNNNYNYFKILPSVQEVIEFNGLSNLNFDNIKFAFSPNKNDLPLRFNYTQHIEKASLNKSQVSYLIDDGLDIKKEGYKIDISINKIVIKAKDKSGLFYAFVTLDQLLEDSKNQNLNLPIVKLTDYPSLPFRPIHIDVKHHMEKESYYYELMDQLARLKINGVILEIEDKIKYERRPEIGSSDAYTINQWIALSEYAIKRNIIINPLVQGLGHASFILKHEKNKHLRDVPTSDWAFNPLKPETYELQFDLYLDAIKATPYSKYLHVGGDEVYLVERDGKSELELNLIWLNKVCDFAKTQNRIPIFWDDMLLKHAGLYNPMFDDKMSKNKVDQIWKKNEWILMKFIEKFPKNAVYMRWNYQKSDTYGNQKAIDWYVRNGLNVMGATAGQTRWTLMPQSQSNISQIRSFALSSIEKKMDGLLLTLWDDDSPHFELYKRGISAFSEYTWSGNKKTIDEFKSIYRHRIFGYEFSNQEYAFIDKLEKPVELWLNMLLSEKSWRPGLSKKENPKEFDIIDLPDLKNKGKWSVKYSKKIKKAKESLLISNKVYKIINYYIDNNSKNNYTIQIYKQVNELVKFSSNCIVALEKLDLSDTLDEVDYEKLALKEINDLQNKFDSLRIGFEKTYSITRMINKPSDYILDQDHHHHPANQTLNFDWQFLSEIWLLEKIKEAYN